MITCYNGVMLLFVLGRQPEIGFAELRAMFGPKVELHGNLALLDDAIDVDFDRLGSIVKVAEVVDDAWKTIDQHLPAEGKVTIGLSTYGTKLSPRELFRFGLDAKKHRGSVRLVPSTETALSSATVFHNKLTKPNKIEFILATIAGREVLAKTIFVQDIPTYTFRDRSRPKRDARVGMLPPKLAQTMINLAAGAAASTEEANQTLLDPFCGTGVVLQEAALMGLSVYGIDLEPRMIEYSQANLEWLGHTHRISVASKLEVGDATSHRWQSPIDIVATETHLGRPFATAPSPAVLAEVMKTCNIILSKFLSNLREQITPEAGLTIAVPCWFANGKTHHLPLIRNITDIGFEQVFYSDKPTPLVYHREDQVVGRELLVLRKH